MNPQPMPLGVHSEAGKLRKVMVCSPGLAHQRLTPANCDELLFDELERIGAQFDVDIATHLGFAPPLDFRITLCPSPGFIGDISRRKFRLGAGYASCAAIASISMSQSG